MSMNGTVSTAQLPLLVKVLPSTMSLRPPEITTPVPGGPRSAVPRSGRWRRCCRARSCPGRSSTSRSRSARARRPGRRRPGATGRRRCSGCWSTDPVLLWSNSRVLDDQVAARVGARVAERRVLGVGVVEGDVAVRARADVVVGVGHVRRVGVGDGGRARAVADEDAVRAGGLAGRVVGRGRRQVRTRVGTHADRARAVAAVPPDLVAAAVGPGEEVAHGEVVDRDAVDLRDLDTVAPGRVAGPSSGPRSWSAALVEHCGAPGLVPSITTLVAVHAPQVEVGRRRARRPPLGVAADPAAWSYRSW